MAIRKTKLMRVLRDQFGHDAFRPAQEEIIRTLLDGRDVRFVLHRDVPASLEAYYQEAGRAGRDGAFARCVVIYRPADLGRASFFAGNGQLTGDEVERGRQGLLLKPSATLKELTALTGLGTSDLVRLVDLLKKDKIVGERRGRIKLLKPDFDPQQVSLAREEQRSAYERSRLEMMRGYTETTQCRRCYLLNYFGENLDQAQCDACDNDILPPNEGRVVVIATAPRRFAICDGRAGAAHHARRRHGAAHRRRQRHGVVRHGRL